MWRRFNDSMMIFQYTYLYFYISSIFVISAFEKPIDVMVRIDKSARIANVTWKVPTGTKAIEIVVILYNSYSEGRHVLLYKHVQLPSSEYMITKHLQRCREYDVHLLLHYGNGDYSDRSRHKFIMSDNPMTTQLSVNPKHAFVGDTVTFKCKPMVQGCPDFVLFRPVYTFHGIYGTKTGDKLVVKTVSRRQKGLNVTCTAKSDSTLKSGFSNMITIDPYYGPDTVDIEGYQRTINIAEGDTLGPFKCATDCYPPCIIKWKLNNTDQLSSEPIFSITHIKRSQSGTYLCQANHTSDIKKFREKVILVNVQYSSTINKVKINKTNYIEGMTYSLPESKNLEISMAVAGNPEPLIHFYKSGSHKTPVECTKIGLICSFYKHGLRCEDSGQYILEASNGVKNESVRTVRLDVQCKPRDMVFDCNAIKAATKAVDNISVTLVANPRPTVKWIGETDHNWRVIEVGNSIHKGSSNVMISDAHYLGSSGVKICNQLGCAVRKVTCISDDQKKPISESVTLVAGALSAVVIMLLISNTVFLSKLVKARRIKQKYVVKYDPDKMDSKQAAYCNVNGDIQVQEEEADTNRKYEALTHQNKSNVYINMQDKPTEASEENMYSVIA